MSNDPAKSDIPGQASNTIRREATGIAGLDDVLEGGFPASRTYLIRGQPGAGKTTLALQFLLEGARLGQKTLYITLSETEEEIRQVAASHGWDLRGVAIFELSSAEQTLRLEDENTLYAAEDVELKETIRVLLDEVERVQPRRVVFDSLSEVQILAQTPIRYRRQLLALKQHFIGRDCTTLLLDDCAVTSRDAQVESLVHGVVSLETINPQYGADRRRLRVTKLRGSRFRSGYHDYGMVTGGLTVFPRLVAAEHRTQVLAEPISSGVAGLDAMLGGGIDRATCTLILGPPGTGKSALATQFAVASAARGEPASYFLFEERIGTWLQRGRVLGMPLDALLHERKLHIHQIDPAELAPDEFTHLVRRAVERDQSKVIVIDSITGYFSAMPEARALSLQMHELLSYLGERGVASVMTMAQTGLVGGPMTSTVDVSYLADTVLLLRYFESGGKLHKAISTLKKRSGYHELSIRGLHFDRNGMRVGDTLSHVHGIFTGAPVSARRLPEVEGEGVADA